MANDVTSEPAAGRRRHGYKADGQAAERGDALGAVDGGAAAEGQNGVRLQGLQAGDALRHQRKRGIGRDVGENLDLRAGKGRGIAGGRAVFGKIGVRDEQHALGVQPARAAGASAPKHSRVPQTKLCMTSPLFGDSISARAENM